MTSFLRYRPVISNFVGGPGINTFHGTQDVLPILDSQAQQFADEIRAVYLAAVALYINGVTISFPAEMTEHDEATGDLMAVHPIDPPAQVTGTGSAAASNVPRDFNICARLITGTIRDGKRLQGRLFMGPNATTHLDSQGQVTASARTTLASAFGGILDLVGPNLMVWGPPKRAADGSVIAPGKLGRVVAVQVNTVPGTLRSRKT